MAGIMDRKESAKEAVIRASITGRALFDEPMSRHTSLRIGGPADALAFPDDVESLSALLVSAFELGVRTIAIGKGTNMLVPDEGIRGVAVSLTGMKEIKSAAEGIIEASAGASLQAVVNESIALGFEGIECLSGIPGTLGGAIAGNAGAFGQEIGGAIESATLVCADGKAIKITASELGLSYRSSSIPSGCVIASAKLRFRPGDSKELKEKAGECLRKKKASQPLAELSAGCAFKNPEGGFAGKLIDECGLKGFAVGGARVSKMHANFIINSGGATSEDYMRLMDEIRNAVFKRAGIRLEPEIRIITNA